MKLLVTTLALIHLSANVKASWFLPVLQPVLLTLGTAFTALNLEVLNFDV